MWAYAHDNSEANDNLRSATGGGVIGASKTLTVDPGAGVANGTGIWWLQCRAQL
jgi:hypothetical protein